MAENFKKKLVKLGPFLVENINPSPLLWTHLRAKFIIDGDEEERCKVCIYQHYKWEWLIDYVDIFVSFCKAVTQIFFFTMFISLLDNTRHTYFDNNQDID